MQSLQLCAFAVVEPLVVDELRDHAGKGAGMKNANLLGLQGELCFDFAKVIDFLIGDLIDLFPANEPSHFGSRIRQQGAARGFSIFDAKEGVQ
jgi:hypothetical protein